MLGARGGAITTAGIMIPDTFFLSSKSHYPRAFVQWKFVITNCMDKYKLCSLFLGIGGDGVIKRIKLNISLFTTLHF